ncbi:MAG: DUF302 domain-containing protein [Brevundimonas sp.]|uniref:DUF302 domain-containing protein n=1 Tax=Brevundimonas sp. TaxID=1871086 RepID=UPI002716B0BE|nr:DUF302 domain-containing protein [Brevundimonas sp.]MDO9076665.1 DUF302 domain-containing protein [Brevundimonas sp.]MDP3081482.1 DUF302 domain-containing protein [Brevundimonas sp.]MDZ4059808.1 DUF302 domain-containing protein [Brevundimonas sp.]
MTYYYSKTTDRPFEETVARTRDALKAEGFGIITEINVTETFREKLDLAFRPYVILGACNPKAAHEALMQEDKVGVMLPCNVIVQQLPSGSGAEVAAVDPAASMAAIDNPALKAKAAEIGASLRRALDRL